MQGPTVQLNAVASGGSGAYTYAWTSVPAGFTSTLSNPTVNPLVTTTYRVAVFDGFTTVNAQVSVTVNPLPVATASNNGPVCVGSALSLTGGPAGMLAYAWSGPNGYSNATMSPVVSTSATVAMAGVYNLTVINSSGCISIAASTTVTVNASPVATALNSGPVCTGSPSATCRRSFGDEHLYLDRAKQLYFKFAESDGFPCSDTCNGRKIFAYSSQCQRMPRYSYHHRSC